ncbi:MAG: hypothetical protein EOO87_09600 [Pedobacter sp.]|nr:MAG: hypothetical protein EOO87_09600 [Pedobacter sp.]
MKKLNQILAAIMCFSTIATSSFGQVTPVTKQILLPRTAVQQIETKIELEPITETLCPNKLERGDREFDGHGPKIKCEVKLRLASNGTELWADITFWAQETTPDYSTTTGKWSKKVYDAPYGKKILQIKSDQASRTAFVSPPAGAQFLVPGSDISGTLNTLFEGGMVSKGVLTAFGIPTPGQAESAIVAKLISTYTSGNTVIKIPALEGALVKYFHIVGDTGGDDISNDDNCNDDTRIQKLEFFPVRVIMGNR